MTLTLENTRKRTSRTHIARPKDLRIVVGENPAPRVPKADLPIPFTAPMASKTWDGLKTHTRRLVRPQPPAPLKDGGGLSWHWYAGRGLFMPCGDLIHLPNSMKGGIASPYRVGEIRWVREPWATERRFDNLPPRDLPDGVKVWFLADGLYPDEAGRGRPGMFLPRRLSRQAIEVTGVRLEHLQGISNEDAVAEGCHRVGPCDRYPYGNTWGRLGFSQLWDSINAKSGHGWDVRWWWVWDVEFRRVKGGSE